MLKFYFFLNKNNYNIYKYIFKFAKFNCAKAKIIKFNIFYINNKFTNI